ncbi:MAG: hypothetical protein ACKOA8_01995 [Deltaproteobacteria bacterium]
MGKKPAEKKDESTKLEKPKKVESKKSKVVKNTSPVVAKTGSNEPSCKVASCKREYRAKGYCDPHYKKWKQGAFGVARYKTCGDLDCRKPMVMNRHGYCEEHYQNYYVKGLAVAKAAPAEKPAAEKKEAAG